MCYCTVVRSDSSLVFLKSTSAFSNINCSLAQRGWLWAPGSMCLKSSLVWQSLVCLVPGHFWVFKISVLEVCDGFFSLLNLNETNERLFSGRRQWRICVFTTVLPPDFSTALYPHFVFCCLSESKVNPPQSQQYRRFVPVLVYVHPYCAKAHLFQPCEGLQNMPYLSTEWIAHTTQTNWTVRVKRAQAWYGLPSVSAPLNTLSTCP